MKSVDICVVGAGPAGCVAALQLVRAGLEVLGMRRHSGPVMLIEFSSNGKLLVTAGTQVAVWNANKE